MPVSGMRYKGTLDLVREINEKKEQMKALLMRLESERTIQVTKIYGGEAADNFKENVKKVSNYIEETITDILSKLTTEAETQHDAYMAQEQRLRAQVTMEK